MRNARKLAEQKLRELEESLQANGLNGLKNGTTATTTISNGVNGSINKYLDSELQHHHNNNKKNVDFNESYYSNSNSNTELINRKKQ